VATPAGFFIAQPKGHDMSIQALRERKQQISQAANALLAENGDRVWSAEDQKKHDGFMDDLVRVNAQIKAYEKQLDEEADNVVNEALRNGSRGGNGNGGLTARDATALWLRKGLQDLNAEQAVAVRNAMSTTTPTEGGYTVPSEVAASVTETQKAFGGIREVAQVIATANGNAWGFPTSDGTAEEGEIVGENQAATGADVVFGSVPLVIYKFGSKKIALPIELIMDSGIDVVAFVINRLFTRIARRQNRAFTMGSGAGEPSGIVPRSLAGKVGATGQTVTVTYDDLVDLKHSVNRAYRTNARWSLADSSLRVISKIKDTSGRPIFTPSYEMGITKDAPDLLLGQPLNINDDIPAMAASAKSIIYGDHKQYVIRDVMDPRIARYTDSNFDLNGQVGFCGWSRAGGNLIDTSAVKYYQNSAS
jgi:HK97 family phage major capsid protein